MCVCVCRFRHENEYKDAKKKHILCHSFYSAMLAISPAIKFFGRGFFFSYHLSLRTASATGPFQYECTRVQRRHLSEFVDGVHTLQRTIYHFNGFIYSIAAQRNLYTNYQYRAHGIYAYDPFIQPLPSSSHTPHTSIRFWISVSINSTSHDYKIGTKNDWKLSAKLNTKK